MCSSDCLDPQQANHQTCIIQHMRTISTSLASCKWPSCGFIVINFIVGDGVINDWVAAKHVKIWKFTASKIIYLNSVLYLFYNMFSAKADNSCALFVDIPMFIIESTDLARFYHRSGRLHNEIIMMVPLIPVAGDAWLWYQSWLCHEHWFISCCE